MYVTIAWIVLAILTIFWFIAPFIKSFQENVLLDVFDCTAYGDSFEALKRDLGAFIGFVLLHYVVWMIAVFIVAWAWPGLLLFLLFYFVHKKFIKK